MHAKGHRGHAPQTSTATVVGGDGGAGGDLQQKKRTGDLEGRAHMPCGSR